MDSTNTTLAVKNMDFDNWDPRKKDFQDTRFNSYLVGPGSYLDSSLLPGVSRQQTDDVRFKLHVRNIPSDLTEKGLKNLFSNFGEILDIYRSPTYDWGFISYATIREAELAIRELNRNKKLFNLVVQFARSVAEKERLKQEEIKADMLETAVSRIPFVAAETKALRKPSLGIGRGSFPLHLQTFGNPGRRSAQTTTCKKEKDGFFAYPIPGLFDTVNRAVMDSVSVKVDSEIGHRQVTMGRGYFPLALTSLIIKEAGKSMQPACGSFKEGRYEFGEKPDLSSLMEECYVCGTNTTNYCQVCRTPYCSRNCQKMDWPEHKKHCSVNGIVTEKKLQQQEIKPRKERKSSVLGKTTNEKPLSAPTGISTSSSIIDWLSHNDVISGRLTRWTQEKTCYLLVVPSKLQKEFNKIKDLLPLACDTLLDSNYKPEVGEMVAALVRDEQMSWMKWNRGFVLSVHKDHYQVNLCDLGLIAKVTTVIKLPEDFINIPGFGVHCTIIENKLSKDMKWVPLETEVVLNVQNVNKDDKKVTCKTENECIVVLRKWSPNIEIGDLEAVSLKSGDAVVLTTFLDQSNVFVRAVTQKNRGVYERLCRDVAVHCYRAPQMPVSPVTKQLVGCRFSGDGNYYRAQILHINENDIEVCFVDYGNIEIVTQNDLKELTEEIKMYPCMAVKVSLEDVDCVPLTEAALEFVYKLIGREEEMKIFFSSEGAKLQLPKAKTVNEELRLLLEPSWKRKLQQGFDLFGSTVFMEQDLPILEPPLNKPIELFILNKLDDFTFMCCEFSSKTMYYIQDILTKQITEYCNTCNQDQYIPRSQELCLAKWDVDENWYRALFISDHKVKLENNILFVDFGNMAYVDYKDIRKMISDFMKISTPAFLCTIECKKELPGIADSVKVGLVYEAIIVKKTSYCSFLIEMPHVTAIQNEIIQWSH